MEHRTSNIERVALAPTRVYSGTPFAIRTRGTQVLPVNGGHDPIVPQEASCPSPALERPGADNRPTKVIVSREEAMRWDPRECLIQQKFDGTLACWPLVLNGCNVTLLGEYVVPKSGGFFTSRERELFERAQRSGRNASYFAAFTVAEIDGQNLLRESNRVRFRELDRIYKIYKMAGAVAGHLFNSVNPVNSVSNIPIILAETVAPENIPALIAAGAEGVVSHRWDAAWGVMECAKVLQTWICRVTETGYTQSVGIADAETGEPRGRVKLGGGKSDRVRVGSLIKVEGMGLTAKGAIREPRPCADTETSWLVKQ